MERRKLREELGILDDRIQRDATVLKEDTPYVDTGVAYTPEVFMVTQECRSKVNAVCSSRRKLSGGSGGFGVPKSWGSILYRQGAVTEYVVSFQGTELDDPEMFGFIIAQEPVLLTYTSDWLWHHLSVVHCLYVESGHPGGLR